MNAIQPLQMPFPPAQMPYLSIRDRIKFSLPMAWKRILTAAQILSYAQRNPKMSWPADLFYKKSNKQDVDAALEYLVKQKKLACFRMVNITFYRPASSKFKVGSK